jgi:putative ABC transport system permease protein
MRVLFSSLRYSLRMLRKNPGLTAAVVATLMLGIGATTAIYTVVYAVLLAPLPYPMLYAGTQILRGKSRRSG